jgi:hypothetical protein
MVGVTLGCVQPERRPGGHDAIPGAGDARLAAGRALPFLERDGAAWMAGEKMPGGGKVPGGGKCVSCHHVGFTLWSHREAQRAGLPIPSDRIAALEAEAYRHFAEHPSKARPVAWSEVMLGRDPRAVGNPAAGRRRAAEEALVAAQEEDGRWEATGQFPDQRRPEEESNAVATMWTALALASFDDLTATARASRDRAWRWIQQSPPGQGHEWLVTRLLVELRTGQRAAAFIAALIGQQGADGGWGWRAGEPSNALSTGESLYALSLAGLGPADPAVRRGVRSLVDSQRGDGTWPAASALFSKDSGPNADYVYTYWGTAWATIGLARTLPPAHP